MEPITNLSPKFNTKRRNSLGVFSLERIRMREAILEELVPVMNEIHEVNYSFRFWKIVIGGYVNTTISIRHILEKRELPARQFLFAINSNHETTVRQNFIARLPALIRHFKTLSNQKKINHILNVEKIISMGLPDIEAVAKDTGRALPSCYPLYFGKGDLKKRDRVNTIAKKTTNIYFRNIILRLPRVYVEYFDKDLERIPLVNPKEKELHVHTPPGHYYAMLIAKYVENGAKLYWYQHGAYYGELVGHNAYNNENNLADEYRTWGWKIKNNDVPWKAYRLEKFKTLYDKFEKKPRFDFLLCYPYVEEGNITFFKAGTEYFLQHIDTAKYGSLLARPRALNRIFSHAKNLGFIKDRRVIIDSGLGSMAGTIAKCKVVIQFTVPATNFLECLYVDHPTIGLLDNDQPTDIIKPYYDFFIEKGLLHNDFISLVNHLNKIDVDEWWKALIQEPVYIQFKHEFLRKV